MDLYKAFGLSFTLATDIYLRIISTSIKPAHLSIDWHKQVRMTGHTSLEVLLLGDEGNIGKASLLVANHYHIWRCVTPIIGLQEESSIAP